MVVASSVATAKGLGDRDVHTTKSPSLQEPPANIEVTPIGEASMLDIALVSGRARTVNRDTVCGLLTKCL
jgi:hypothetical protein